MFRVIENSAGTVIMIDIMHRFTLDTLGLTAFDFNFESLEKTEQNEWTETYTTIQKGFQSPIPFVFAKYDWALKYILPGRKTMLKNVDRLNGLLLSIAEKRRQEIKDKKFDDRPDSEKDLLTLILESEIREEGFIHNEEIKVIFFFQ
jgi:cytochrome P450